MRFSIMPSGGAPWEETVALLRHCEATGWDGAYYSDHFFGSSSHSAAADGPRLECWSVIAALAVAVPRIRLGSLVSGNTYRHPAVLANAVATIDQICGGRLILGMGSGWKEDEHVAYGINYPSPSELMDRLEEACQVLNGLLRQDRTTFHGKYYQLNDAPLGPRPVRSRIPLLVGGQGERRTLRIVAKYADEWNICTDPETLRAKREVLFRHCEEVGRDPAEIVISNGTAVELEGLSTVALPPNRLFILGGSPQKVVDDIGRYREAGVDELIVQCHNWSDAPQAQLDNADRFREVVAALV